VSFPAEQAARCFEGRVMGNAAVLVDAVAGVAALGIGLLWFALR
jgi:hypothetical protein